MAVKTYRLTSSLDANGGSAALSESDVTAATTPTGWTVAKLAAGNSTEVAPGVKVASGSFSLESTTPKPRNPVTRFDTFKSPALVTGTFAATAWTFTFAVRAATASAQAGRVRLRVYRHPDANPQVGTPVELTGSTQVGTTTAVLSTTADVTSVVTWSPGATFTLTNEYLFFQIAWETTTAGGSNNSDVLFRTGQAAGGTRIVTPDLSAGGTAYTATPADTLTLSDTLDRLRASVRTPADLVTLVDSVKRQKVIPAVFTRTLDLRL